MPTESNTPAPQPFPAPECKFCGTTDRMSNPCSGPDGVGHIFDQPLRQPEQPSPARNDTEGVKCAECGGWSNSTAELHNAGCSKTAGEAQAERDCEDCEGSGRISPVELCARCNESGVLPGLADRAPSGESIANDHEFLELLSFVGKTGSRIQEETELIAYIDARSATAGTAAAPSDKATARILRDLAALLPGEFMWGDALQAATLGEILDAYDSQRATAGNVGAAPNKFTTNEGE